MLQLLGLPLMNEVNGCNHSIFRNNHRDTPSALHLRNRSRYPVFMKSNAATVQEYLKELPSDHAQTVSEVRDLILENIPLKKIAEIISGGY